MDNSVLDNSAPEEQERLLHLQQELEGQELVVLLQRLLEQFSLSVNQAAISAEMDESALHKILAGQNREFKADHSDALLDDLETLGKLTNSIEKSIWRRALHIAAFQHFDLYKSAEPRLKKIEDPSERATALAAYLRSQYPALAETYDNTGGQFPAFLPLADIVARDLLRRWGWIKIPEGYKLNRVEGDHYYLTSTDLLPKKLTSLDPNMEVKDTGFGTFTIRRKPLPKISNTPSVEKAEPTQPEPKPNRLHMGGIEWVRILAGKFLMGSKADNASAYDDEKPQHTVDIPYEYLIGRVPVTNAQYREFAEAHKLNWEPSAADDHPAVNVSWHDAVAYCDWLTQKLRKSGAFPANSVVRLPTEAEWEKAARGDAKRANEWPWGNDFEPTKCNTSEGGPGSTTPVGAYSSAGGDSPYGVADMVGNVWEWCGTLFTPYPYKADDGREDLNSTGARVLRGGAWNSDRRLARCAFRNRDNPGYFYRLTGFGCVRLPSLIPGSELWLSEL